MRHDPKKIKELFSNGTCPYKTRIRKAVYKNRRKSF